MTDVKADKNDAREFIRPLLCPGNHPVWADCPKDNGSKIKDDARLNFATVGQVVEVMERYAAAVTEHPEHPECPNCGGKQSQNPHPEAGKVETLLEIGAMNVCVPCTVKSRHKWASRATKAETDLAAVTQERDALLWSVATFHFDQCYEDYCQLCEAVGKDDRTLAAEKMRAAIAKARAAAEESQPK